LTIAERLSLFLRVCETVQHAHAKLIVHRDLKPANLLVTRDGEPKLLDFGIAKILDPAAWPHTRAETRRGQRWLTPAFASPEQKAGEPLGTATDVYSLGVVLFLLLAGRLPEPGEPTLWPPRPRKTSSAPTPEPASAVGPPQPLSLPELARHRQLAPRRLVRLFRGELHTVVAKAMHPEVSRRYRSVEQLADDLRRFLDQRPIQARPDSLPYRCSKFLRRNRLAVATLALVVLSLLLGLLGTTWQARRAHHQQVRAEHFLDMLVEAAAVADPWATAGEPVPMDQVLEDWTRQLRFWMERYPTDRAQVLETIGRVRLRQGRLEQADDALSEALDERRRAVGGEHPSLARSYASLVELRFEQGRLEQAEALARRALDLRRRAGVDMPALAESLNDLGAIVEVRGRPAEARTLYRQALDLRRRHLGPSHPLTANSLGNLGTLAFHAGELEEAEDLLRSAVGLLDRFYGPEHPMAAEHRVNLASVLRQLGRGGEAEDLLRESLESQLEILGSDHPTVARSRLILGISLARERRLDEAESLLRAAFESQHRLSGPDHPLVAEAALHLGDVRFRRGDPAEAETLYRLAVESLGARTAASAADRRRSLGRLADLLRHTGRPARAVPFYRQVLAVEAEAGTAAEPGFDRPRWLLSLAISLGAAGDWAGAVGPALDAACLRLHRQEDASRALEVWSRAVAGASSAAAGEDGSDPERRLSGRTRDR
ncbi:MAG: tetratricopeptide repeat-containing serine/threonine-protein kinase, partial [Holophagales bacterium]|nr:tetratricopeptide repeat-containing serine/threonine-protein kinase [Holophagales bacterium]